MSDGASLRELRKFVAPEIVFGPGARRRVGQYAQNYGARHVLLVSDPGLIAAGWTAQVEQALQAAGLAWSLFSGVTPNPKDYEVTQGAEVYRQEKCDLLVAVGGGSVIDCAKGIGILAVNEGPLGRYEGVDEVPLPGPPLICVPTTAGTSADVSQFAILTDTPKRVKAALVSKMLVPDVSLIDPETTTTLSAELTRNTGIDALTHAFEAYVSTASSPLTDLHALAAVRRIAEHLVEAVRQPQSLEVRTEMMCGALLAGLAFSNASLGLLHAMSHALGGESDAAHGLCNAVVLRQVVAFNFPAAPERYRALGEALGLPLAGAAPDEVLERLLEKLDQLAQAAGIDSRLCQLGTTVADVASLAAKAVNDPCLATNPRPATREEIEKLYVLALRA